MKGKTAPCKGGQVAETMKTLSFQFWISLLWMLIISTLTLRSEVTLELFSSIGPNVIDRNTLFQWSSNATKGVDLHLPQVGQGHRAFALAGTTNVVVDGLYLFNTTYNSWGPDVGGTDHGGSLWAGFILRGNGLKIVFQEAIFAFNSPVLPYDKLTFTRDAKKPFYWPEHVGILEKPNGSRTYLTNNPVIPVDSVFIAIFQALSPPFGTEEGVPEQDHEDMMRMCNYSYQLDRDIQVKFWVISSTVSNLVELNAHQSVSVIRYVPKPTISRDEYGTTWLTWKKQGLDCDVEVAPSLGEEFKPLLESSVLARKKGASYSSYPPDEFSEAVPIYLPQDSPQSFFRLRRRE